jgi:type IV pilus assembly protein PilM
MSVLSRIATVLPPPVSLTLPSAGLDVSDSSIKYVRFERAGRYSATLNLAQWGEVDLPAGVITRGEVIDHEKFSAALREVAQVCKTPYVRVSLPEERAYIFETEVKKGMHKAEIDGLIEFRLEENVPIASRDAYFDYTITDDDTRPDMWRVIVTVYDQTLVRSYYEACIAAKLIPVTFEVEAQAIARATIKRADMGTHMIVDFGKTRSGIGIVHRGTLMYTSTIDIGGDELSRTMRRAIGDLSESELTKIKNTEGLVRRADSTEVFDSLISLVSVIRDEIYTRIDYWHTKEHHREDRAIDSLILCGGSVNLKGLPEYFSETLDIPTVRADVWQNAFSIDETLPPIGRRYSYGYATVIGLALGGFYDTV